VGADEQPRIDPTDDHAHADLLDPVNVRPTDVDFDALFDVALS
jgi:hypothetical protein